MNLSKSKFTQGIQCNKILWLEKNGIEKMDSKNKNVLSNGTEVGELAKNLFGEYIDIEFNENLNVMIEDTKKYLSQDNVVITEASFKYNNNFCSVDILKKEHDYYEIYEVKSSTEVKDIYLWDIAYQYYILTNLGLKVKKACLVYINSYYERHGELNIQELFKIKDVSEFVLENQENIANKIDEINAYVEKEDEPIKDLGNHCVTPYDCPYFYYCTKHLQTPNVFNIRRMRNSTKFKLYNKGIITYEDLLNEKLDKMYHQQIEHTLYERDMFIDKDNLKKFLNTISKPLYFLDFETYQQTVPEYDYVTPYMQIPFQYSLHYIDEFNNLQHQEFLAPAGIDPRRMLAEKLVQDIPKNVCVIAYNMMFEKMVIKNLSQIFPDLEEHLLNIHDNMVDLMIPFKMRWVYNNKMDGSYSIKYVLPALFPNDESLDYTKLDLIHNGEEAMTMYANLSNYEKEEQDNIRNSLLKYCELDTLAMVKIYDKLISFIE